MMRRIAGFCALLALSLGSFPAQAQEQPLVLAPASAWVVDYAEGSCALRRNFSAGETQVYLELRQFSPRSSLRITLASNTLHVEQGDPRYRFGDTGDLRSYNLTAYGSYGEGMMGLAFYGDISSDQTSVVFLEGTHPKEEVVEQFNEREASVADLYVENAFESAVQLQTGSLNAPMQALRSCMVDLVASWGAAPFLQDPLAVDAVSPNLQRWARRIQRRFPTSLLNRPGPHVVEFRVLLDAAGEQTDCVVQAPVVDEEYDSFICDNVASTAEFEPARDGQGNPVASFKVMTIVYTND